jgi:hypothetical protein
MFRPIHIGSPDKKAIDAQAAATEGSLAMHWPLQRLVIWVGKTIFRHLMRVIQLMLNRTVESVLAFQHSTVCLYMTIPFLKQGEGNGTL